jgi:hypothetical protein
MTMIPNIIRADNYSIKITKTNGQTNPSENEIFLFEYEEGYDKSNKDHIDAFRNMEQIKDFHERSLSTYGKASVEFDRDTMTVSLKMVAPFEKLANFVSMEFLMCGSLGKITLLDFISMAATSIVSNVTIDSDDNDTDCASYKNMYV